MIANWIERVGSSIPRGYSRYFILEILKSNSYTGKEIIDLATKKSGGQWTPSPGLIYPLLGRLLSEGLIEELDNGKYQATKKGRATADDLETVNNIIKKQLDVIFRIGNMGRFAAMDMLERITTMGTVLSENVSKMTEDEKTKYKEFLKQELEKMEEGKSGIKKSVKKKIKID